MSKEPYPSEVADRFIVRLPDGMRDLIKEAAAANNRSMNAEIVHRLELSFEGGGYIGSEHTPPRQAPLEVSQRDALLGGFEALQPDFQKALLGFVDQLVKQEALKRASGNKHPKP